MALLSPSELAKKFGFSASQIRRMIRDGIVKAEKVGNFYVIDDTRIRHLDRRRSLKRV